MIWFWDSKKQRNTFWTVFGVLGLILVIIGEYSELPPILMVIWLIFGQLILRKLQENENK